MPDCSISITIDGWQADGDVPPTYRLGDPIPGTVHVWVTDEVRCDGLDVQLELVRTMKGYTLPDGPPAVRIFSGTWQPGEYEYRFELPSSFPPTYRGERVGWRWVVKATADIPWASDPKSESPFVLEPAATGDDDLTVLPPPPDGVRPGATSAGFTVFRAVAILFGLALASLAVAVTVNVMELVSEDRGGDLVAFGLIGTVGTGLWLLTLWMRGSVQRGAANRWRASVKLTHAEPGAGYRAAGDQAGGVDCEVQTRGGGVIERVVAELVVREYVQWRKRDPSTNTNVLQQHERVLAQVESSLVGDGATGTWRGRLPLPELDPRVPRYTLFDDIGRGLLWQVNVLSYAKGRDKPDVETRNLTVAATRTRC